MANEQDVKQAIGTIETALDEGQIAAARKGLEELSGLARLFEKVAAELDSPQSSEQAGAWAERAKTAFEALSQRLSELEIDRSDPEYEARSARRRQRTHQERVEGFNRAAELLAVFGPQIAGLVDRLRQGKPIGDFERIGGACPHCAAEVLADARFCLSCGKPLRAQCAQCGRPLPQQARFCPGCGAQVSQESDASP